MTYDPLKLGSFVVGDRITDDQVNYLNTKLPTIPDGEEGGTYVPTNPLSIADLECPTAPTAANDVVNKTYADQGIYARYNISSLSASRCVLVEDMNQTGFSVASSVYLSVPSTGLWFVTFAFLVLDSSTAAESQFLAEMSRGGGGIYAHDKKYRQGTSAAEGTWLSGSGFMPISNIVTHTIDISVSTTSGGTLTSSAQSGAHLCIYKVSS
jgi:hypothetical protein